MRKLATLIPVLLLASWFVLLRPGFMLNGPADYIFVSGISMEPTLYTGDLVVVRRASDYEVGDVIAFRVPEGGVVIHRIVGGNAAEGFVPQGDNRNEIDDWRPTPDEILGRQWFAVPGGASQLLRLGEPVHFGIAAAGLFAIGGINWRTSSGRARRRTVMTSEHGGERHESASGLGSMPPLPAALFLPLALGAGAILLFAAIGFGAFREDSSHSAFDEQLAYEHQGGFDYYLVMEPSRLYPGGIIAPSETDEEGTAVLDQPVYTNLAREMVVRFNYALSSSLPPVVGGELGFELQVRAGDGWTQTPITIDPMPFEGAETSGELRFRFSEIAALVEALEAETGFTPARYELQVVPTVDLQGALGPNQISEQFSPVLSVEYSDTEIRPATLLSQSEPTSLGETIQVSNTYAPLGLELTVARWRQVAVAGFVLGAVVLGGALAVWLLGVGRDEDGRIQARYHSMLLRVQPGQAGTASKVTVLATMSDLARLARRDGGIIFMEQGLRGTRYFVREGEDSYEYVTGQGDGQPAGSPFSNLTELAGDRE